MKSSASQGAQTAGDTHRGWRSDLLRWVPGLKWLLGRRWFQFAVVLPNLFLFLLFLTAGTFGSPVGNRNIIIVLVWIFWWFLLISVLVPLASRVWCMMCPFPFFGEWIQRRSLIRARGVDPKDRKSGPGVVVGRNRFFGLNRRWPKALSNIWLQNIGFLLLCTFSTLFLTRPIVSVFVLGMLFVIATVLHLVFRHRAFCSYVCPVSGFLSLYSMASAAEIRAKDTSVCTTCKEKACLVGSEKGWGCPWYEYPSKMERNNYCGLCMECFKTCQHDNMAFNLRPFFSDTVLKGWDEAWKAFIMLSLAIAYSAVYLGPWAILKDWTNVTEKQNWGGFLTYTAILWVLTLAVIPAIYALTVQLGRWLARDAPPVASEPTFKEVFLGFVYPLVPLGLLAWIAFSLPLLLVNGSYILMVISDPFGWGWDIFGTSHVHWTPVAPHWTPHVQVALLLIALYHALKKGYAHAERLFVQKARALRAFAPVSLLLCTVVVFFMIFFAG